jgi:transcriptional regulator with XRE-family HTH domain
VKSSNLEDLIKQKLAEAIARARGELSQAAFAKRLGVSQSTVQSWETGKNSPSLENLEKIAEVTGQLPEEFLAYLYGRDVGASLSIEDRIRSLSIEELASLLEAVSRRLAKGE